MSNLIILGSQWGDEGKGKIVDLLSDGFDIVARYQGGHNAGHTILIGDRKFVLKLIPSGILHPGKRAVIGNGLVIDPAALLAEIEMLQQAGVAVTEQLRISNRAHVLLPSHRTMEKLSEDRPGRVSIGTTSRGIGPCYEDKAARRGIRMADLLDRDTFMAAYDALAQDKKTVAAAFGIDGDLDLAAIRAEYLEFAERIRPMVCDTAQLLNDAIAAGKSVLFEGAQGTMLDLDHGTYPFVTSSSSAAGGACTGTGVPPTRIDGVIGVSKAYITRVGGGPFPSEALDSTGDEIRKRGNEFGSVTGRPRRCGWFDVPLLRYTAMINGFDSLAITKLDVLDALDEIPVCVKYRSRGRELLEMPGTSGALAAVEPVYESLPGWRTPTGHITEFAELPENAKRYVYFLEKQTGVEVGSISAGPERNQTVFRPDSRFLKLTKSKNC
ncbi:MAG: adenylosuccinate synthase [Acidobacteriota bacterium]|nr:adenylosuccinate synthase [Acidobacteriota bacterium]